AVYGPAMRESARVLAFVGAALVPIACGGATPSPQNPAPVAVGSDPVAVAADDPHLAPVAEPAEVVAVARWKSPRRVFDTLQQWVGMPLPIDEAIEKIFRVPGMNSVVVTDAPVEFLVALDPNASDRNPEPFLAFSVGMRSVEDARRVIQGDRELREVHEGVYRVEIGPEYDRITCFLAPSVGASAGRMVCGPRERSLEALYPYMTRGLPVASMPDSDLHAEVRLSPIQQRYGKMLPGALEMGASVLSHEIGTGDRNLDRAITDAVSALGQELLALSNDLDGLTLDVRVDPTGKSLSGDMSLAFKDKSSWLAQRMFDNAGKAGPPPPIFWSAPAASDAAFFDRGVDGKNYAAIKRHGGNLIDAGLAHENFPPADRKAVVDLFERLLEGSPVSVSASGHIDPGTPGAGATDFDRIREAIAASLGWQLVGLEEGPTRIDKWLRDFAQVYRRPSIQRWLRNKTSLDIRSMPSMRYGVHAAAGLPGLKALRLTVPATAIDRGIKGRPKPIDFYVMVWPSGSRTWVAMGADEAVLVKQLKAVKAGGGATIEGKAGLEALKANRIVSGGYMTMAGLAAQATASFMDTLRGSHYGYRNRELEQLLNALARIPNHGETPILFMSQVEQGSPAKVSVQFKVNRGTIDDLRALVLQLQRPPIAPPPPRP
ncbi:MAG: hypothetical protein ACOC1F_03855, partial [Myxococcota bacterium]